MEIGLLAADDRGDRHAVLPPHGQRQEEKRAVVAAAEQEHLHPEALGCGESRGEGLHPVEALIGRTDPLVLERPPQALEGRSSLDDLEASLARPLGATGGRGLFGLGCRKGFCEIHRAHLTGRSALYTRRPTVK